MPSKCPKAGKLSKTRQSKKKSTKNSIHKLPERNEKKNLHVNDQQNQKAERSHRKCLLHSVTCALLTPNCNRVFESKLS